MQCACCTVRGARACGAPRKPACALLTQSRRRSHPHTPQPPPQAWRLSGDIYAKDKPGEKPWISEMYGYVFGAASLGIRHRWDESSMIYPGYRPTGKRAGGQRGWSLRTQCACSCRGLRRRMR